APASWLGKDCPHFSLSTPSRNKFVNLDHRVRLSVMIHRHIILIQLSHQKSRGGVKSGWKLPEKLIRVSGALLKYIHERCPCNVNALSPGVVDRIVRHKLAGRRQSGDDLP